MTLEDVALGIQIVGISLLLLSICVIPMVYTFWKDKFKR